MFRACLPCPASSKPILQVFNPGPPIPEGREETLSLRVLTPAKEQLLLSCRPYRGSPERGNMSHRTSQQARDAAGSVREAVGSRSLFFLLPPY